MHGGSSKNDKKFDKDYNWMNLETCIPPGDFVYLACTNWKWLPTNWKSLRGEHLVHQG